MTEDILDYSPMAFAIIYALKDGERLEHNVICDRVNATKAIGTEIAKLQALGYIDTNLTNTRSARLYGLTPKGFRLAYLIALMRDIGVDI